MKSYNLKKIILILAMINLNSCSFFNNNYAELRIASNPQGARIIVDGRQVGITPTVINLPVKNYMMNITKDGYGSALLDVQAWSSIKTDANNKIVGDGYRCILDSLNFFLFFTIFTKNCKDFKKKTYEVNITQNIPQNIPQNDYNQSMIGIGNSPENMIYYHYNSQNNYNMQNFENQKMINNQR